MSSSYEFNSTSSTAEILDSLELSLFELAELAEQASKGELDTYGATPLDHQLAAKQQVGVLEGLRRLASDDVPDETPVEIKDYMEDTFEARFHSRGQANFDNFITALNRNDIPTELEGAVERARMGHASPAEVLLVREAMGIRSAELACLSHPYGKRIEYLEEMRGAVRQSVELLGGIYIDNPETRFRVKGTVGNVYDDVNRVTDGFFMTRKRTLGVMPDGTTIRERTSFILRTEYGGTPFIDLEDIMKINPRADNWREEVLRVGHLDVIADDLMEANEYELAIPVSTTIYAFNEATAAAIDAKYKEDHDNRCAETNEDIRLNYPTLYAAIKEGRARRSSETLPAGAVNYGDMVYIGPQKDGKPF